MAEPTQGASAPKKRSFFKRAAWQDAAKKEGEDMFSHANEFKDIVAEEERRRAEEERQAERDEQRKQAGQRKRRKVSPTSGQPILPRSGSGSEPRKRIGSEAYAHVIERPRDWC